MAMGPRRSSRLAKGELRPSNERTIENRDDSKRKRARVASREVDSDKGIRKDRAEKAALESVDKKECGTVEKLETKINLTAGFDRFKRKSQYLDSALKEASVNVQLKTNQGPERPRKGTFEVKINDEVVVSLVGMPRPFRLLRELDLDKVAADIASRINKV